MRVRPERYANDARAGTRQGQSRVYAHVGFFLRVMNPPRFNPPTEKWSQGWRECGMHARRRRDLTSGFFCETPQLIRSHTRHTSIK